MKDLTGEDYRIVTQSYIDIRFRFEIYDKNDQYIDNIDCGVMNGTASIDAESDIRRTFSITVFPDHRSRLIIDEQGYIWIDKFIRIYIGIVNMRTTEVYWWKFGKFVFTNTNTTYDPVTNQMTINCSDLMANLDGSKNGELGQLEILYPAYQENSEGVPTKYNTIRAAVIDTISQLGRIKEYQIDDIGEYEAMPLYNSNYEKYREESKVPLADGSLQPIWNTIPFDQTFSSGCTVLSIIQTFRDLYPNYEAYFDENGVFCMNMIPSGDEDPVIIEDEFFQTVYKSENTSIDLSKVRNISHVWGQVIENDYYSESVSYSNSTYSATISGYEDEYMNGDKIALKIMNENRGSVNYININGFGSIPIYDENTETFLAQSVLQPNEVYVFKIKKKYINHQTELRAYWLGAWQAQGICALVDNSSGDLSKMLYVNTTKKYTDTEVVGYLNLDDLEFYRNRTYNPSTGKYIYTGKYTKQFNVAYKQIDTGDYYRVVYKYSEDYFKNVYACPTVRLKVIPNSPFTCQKIGEYMDVYSDDKNITSCSLAVSRADWEVYKQARLTDSITLVTKLCPFADVNIKVNYRRHDLDVVNPYIVKNVTHDFNGGTTTWQLMRFYSLYERLNYTHGELNEGRFTHNQLSAYSHERI